ncbi:general transcription factor II-I repeat domain-containing protein 2-like [Oopsacas minuta]|uniref:General transcription factor II-I repeat domain-containing protein 2-like n=1 Tax=Oopsacas minuta TaxID=111878 RepID=A0AAV7JYJ4_9METZ|nr:general transcription factor II-I repeat domain-containing protein 2-like [Oopsacas minuta]
MKPFTDGEYIKECLTLFMNNCCPDKKDLAQQLSPSDTTVLRRVESISNDINDQLLERSRNFTSFSIAMDGSKDISDMKQLVIWIRGVDNIFKITEEMFSVSPMYGKASGIDIFDEVQKVLSIASLPVTKLSGVATDGAPSMLGVRSGFKGQLSRWLAANGRDGVIWRHCIIHQEVLCANTLGWEKVMKLIVDAVNFIRAKGINHREFKNVLKELDSKYGDILYFTAVRWLSR